VRLERLLVRDFRNYATADATFSPELNLISGPNGQGKSNLLEAVYFLITGRSFRTGRLSDLVREGSPSFALEALIEKQGVPQRISIRYGEKERLLLLNKTRQTSFLSLLGLLQGVVFSPGDHSLVSGAPAERRRFYDLHLSQTDPLYVHHLTRYHRALRQRNLLLQKKQLETIESWEHEMARSATYLIEKRAQATEKLQELMQPLHQELSGGMEQLELRYRPSLNGESDKILLSFVRNRSREVVLGHTLAGPHRDDLLFTLDGREARHFGSEGQKVCCVIALRLAEWERVREESGEPPLLLLDDATASLDLKRQERLAALLVGRGQLFLASPEPMALTGHRQVCQISIPDLRSGVRHRGELGGDSDGR
jgi:DNA replication and repair protein RecF